MGCDELVCKFLGALREDALDPRSILVLILLGEVLLDSFAAVHTPGTSTDKPEVCGGQECLWREVFQNRIGCASRYRFTHRSSQGSKWIQPRLGFYTGPRREFL